MDENSVDPDQLASLEASIYMDPHCSLLSSLFSISRLKF